MTRKEEREEVLSDIKKYKSIAALLDQDGGKLLIKALQSDICGDFDSLCGMIRSDEMTIKSVIARMSANVNLLRVLKRSRKNVKMAEEALKPLLEDVDAEQES